MTAQIYGELPALRRGLAIVRVEDGMIIEGGAGRVHFKGAAATDVLPQLLPLLRGSLTRSSLAARLNLHARQLDQVLDLLADRGLLESGATEQDSLTTGYLSRTVPVGSDHRSGHMLQRFLGEQLVHVAAPSPIRDAIVADLTATGVGVAPLLDKNPPPAHSLAIVYDEDDRLEQLVEQCNSRDVVVLRCGSLGGVVEVGPRFLVGKTPCVECFRRGYAQLFPPSVRPQPGTTSSGLPLLAALVTHEALASFQVGSAVAPYLMRRVDTAELAEERLVVAPEPDCPLCGFAERRSTATAEVFGHYEWQVRSTPAELTIPSTSVPPVADQRFYQTDYATSPRRKLTDLSSDGFGPLLAWTVGHRGDGTGTRWAPTGGNLGSVELFVLTEEAWAELPGTVFKYNADEEELVAARSDRPPLASLLAGTGLATEGLYAAVVFCGALWRLAPKYGTFACRLAHLDAGCASAQFALVAGEAGFNVRFADGWTGELASGLELVERREIVTAVAAVYRKEPADADRSRG